jgi:hypothetical protein
MKLKLNKKKMKTLSSDKNSIPKEMTLNIDGGYLKSLGCTQSEGIVCHTQRIDASCRCAEF